MFQGVSLQIAALCELCRERDIRNRLGKLPRILKTAYDELYLKIQSQEESTPMIAYRAFQWVICSCWPLSPAELVAAVCQDPDTDEIDEVDISMNTVLGACQNLLVVDHELNVCRFSHLSVQEYFETHHWSSYEPDRLVGKVCLSLLIANSITSNQEAQLTKKECRGKSANDILEYACFQWVTHVQRLEEKGNVENRLTVLLKVFLGSMDESSLAYQKWHGRVGEYFDISEKRFQGYPVPLRLGVYSRLRPSSLASLAIVRFGFYNTILDWWGFGFADYNQKNSSGDSLLLLGAMGGSVSIVEDLLKKGADVNASGGRYGNALQVASTYCHESIVQLLLDNDADVNVSGGEYGCALRAASSYGHESIVQLLLNKSADVNAPCGYSGSALQAASHYGYKSIVQLLLDKGADVNAPCRKYGSALQVASSYGHESIVQLLLDNGADVNASGGNYGSALRGASYSGHGSVVQLLLDKGADVHASGKIYINDWGEIYGSALDGASLRGHEAVVKLLQAAMNSQ